MFLQTLKAATAALLIVSSALAGEGLTGRAPLEGFFKAVAKRTGGDYKKIELEGIRTLESSKKFSKEILTDVFGVKDTETRLENERALVHFLQKSKRFRVNTGLEQIREQSLASKAGAAMDELADLGHATNVRRAKTDVELAIAHRDAAGLKFKLVLEALQAMKTERGIPDGMLPDEYLAKNHPEYLELIHKKEAVAVELNNTSDEYVVAELNLLTELGIPFEEVNSGVGTMKAYVPSGPAAKRLIALLNSEPDLAEGLKNAAKIYVSHFAIEGTWYEASTNEIYLGLDVLSKLH